MIQGQVWEYIRNRGVGNETVELKCNRAPSFIDQYPHERILILFRGLVISSNMIIWLRKYIKREEKMEWTSWELERNDREKNENTRHESFFTSMYVMIIFNYFGQITISKEWSLQSEMVYHTKERQEYQFY